MNGPPIRTSSRAGRGAEFDAIHQRVRRELDEAVAFAEAGAELRTEKLYEDVYVE